MQQGRASRTAEYNALFRALESCRPPQDRLVADPLARSFLGWPLSLASRLAQLPGAAAWICAFIDRRWPGVRTSLVARTRLIDDAIERALLHERFEQFVVLGAGFDTRAYRLEGLRQTAVFEIDQPSTQFVKRRALAGALVRPTHVRFVECDFVRQDLQTVMQGAGFRETAPSLILWEGVSNYLDADAVDSTLRWCSRAAPGSLLVFTYVHSDIITSPASFVGNEQLFAALEKAGERFTFGIHPEKLAEFFARRGFSLQSDSGAAEYRARYYGAAASQMHGHEFYRVALARVVRSTR